MLEMWSNRLFSRDDDCTKDPNLCEKPAISSKVTPIVIGVVSGVLAVVLISVLVFLHFRKKRRDEREWTKDPQELEDYGMGTGNTRAGGQVKGQNSYRNSQLPYQMKDEEAGMGSFAPSTRRTSAESARDLARNLRQHNDIGLPAKSETPRSMV